MLKIKERITHIKNKDKSKVENKKIKLRPYQKRLNLIQNICYLDYYDETFCVITTSYDSYVLFKLIAPAMQPMRADDIDYIVSTLASSYLTLEYEVQYIIDTDYISLTPQKRFWQRKLEQTQDEGKINYIQEKIFQFEAHEKYGQKEVYYAKVFGYDEKEAIKNAYTFMKQFRTYISIPLSMKETKRLLRFEHNPNERKKRDEELIESKKER